MYTHMMGVILSLSGPGQLAETGAGFRPNARKQTIRQQDTQTDTKTKTAFYLLFASVGMC
jgi:hypothetical protein